MASLLLVTATMSCRPSGADRPPVIVTDVEALVNDVQGFADRTTGGRGGRVYWVTTLADRGRGSLRYGARRRSPRWIRFRVSGTIQLRSPIAVRSNKTIDGRGARIVISGRGLAVDGASNVILENLIFTDGRDDAIHVTNGAQRVWIDHCSFARWGDGLIDVTRGSTDVTVSWCRFEQHDKVMLLSADPRHTFDRAMRVTVHHNHFRGTAERHPRLRFGKVHTYNNYYDRWTSYGAAASMRGELLSQANVYQARWWEQEAVLTHKGRDPEQGYVRSEGDLALGGARIVVRNPERVFDPAEFYRSAVVGAAGEPLATAVERDAGWRPVEMREGPPKTTPAAACQPCGLPTLHARVRSRPEMYLGSASQSGISGSTRCASMVSDSCQPRQHASGGNRDRRRHLAGQVRIVECVRVAKALVRHQLEVPSTEAFRRSQERNPANRRRSRVVAPGRRLIQARTGRSSAGRSDRSAAAHYSPLRG